MEADGVLLRVYGVSKRLGGRPVLVEVSFTLDRGEIVLLRGPNGSGKSTLLRVITGVLEPDSGSVTLMGRDLHADPSIRSEIGYCPERLGLLPDYTIMENLRFFSRILDYPLDRDLLDRYVEKFGLGEYLDQKISKLSMGTRKKVALVRTLLMGASLYVFDEPLANLDEDSAAALVKEIGSLVRDREAGLLVASHIDLPIADRVLEMRGGRVEEVG